MFDTNKKKMSMFLLYSPKAIFPNTVFDGHSNIHHIDQQHNSLHMDQKELLSIIYQCGMQKRKI